jgi:SAM-dependent methyltransferase
MFKSFYETAPRYKEARRLLEKHVNYMKGSDVLDIGSGPEPMISKDGCKSLTVIDNDKGTIIECHRRVSANIEKDRLPFPAKKFDVVIACEVLEHIRTPLDAMKETRRVLADDGIFLMSVPNICSLRNRLKILFGKYPACATGQLMRMWDNDIDYYNNHVIDWNRDVITQSLSYCGFQPIEFSTNGIFFAGRRFGRLRTSFGESLIVISKKKTVNQIS